MVGRLLHTVEAATRHISRYPGIGSLRYASLTGLMELRSIAVRRFPYVILYIDREDRIDLIRLLHLKRDIPRSLPNDE